ncbi:methyltransferase type 11 [Mycobacterium tilburgii]|uniref:methyltransferase type 11 n=1 Tax=Mycobacterium tilburgii TaxID=44467 RepID=UPI001183F88A|nr:methyltransferase type 11 [Mycobacterium tilburgii]
MATNIPIIFTIFNRPDTTYEVFRTIRAAKPDQLLVIADGPRADRPGEPDLCAATRAIIDEVDWDCDVQRNFAPTNLGCRLRVSSGITWAFDLVDKAILLEDDTVPSASFFTYCADLLDRYENDERIMMVSGNNFLFGHAPSATSYYFSRHPHGWGWATWRRAWSKYDLNMTNWPEIRRRKLFDQYLPTASERSYWKSLFQSVYDGNIDTWDYQWVYTIWANSGLSIAPARNLVQNIGFHSAATHTTGDTVYSSLRAEDLDFPLSHPPTVLASSDKDALESRLRVAGSNALGYPLTRYAAYFARFLAGGAARARRSQVS